jgi:hypothetical protein
MTELELYKFIKDNNIEWHKQDNNGEQDVIIFPNTTEVKDFQKLLSYEMFDDGGIECRMMDGYFAFWMKDICEYYGIEIEKVFIGKNYDD